MCSSRKITAILLLALAQSLNLADYPGNQT